MSQTPRVQGQGHDSEMSGPRYSIISARAVFDNRLSSTELHVLAALGTYTDREGWCFPSQKELTAKLGIARSTLSAALKRLASAEFGYIEIRPRTSKGRGKIGNEYRVRLDLPPMSENMDIGSQKPMSETPDIGPQAVEATPMSEAPDIGADVRNAGQPMSRIPDIAYIAERTHINVPKESCSNEQDLVPNPSPKRTRAAYDAEFEAVWKLWPAVRRANSDKRVAFKRWKTGVQQFGADKIEAAAKRYLSQPNTRKENFQYCCLVEVFMNGRLEAAVEALAETETAVVRNRIYGKTRRNPYIAQAKPYAPPQ